MDRLYGPSRDPSSVQCEHEQRRTALEVLKFGRVLQQAQVPRVAAADMNGNVLLAADRVADRRGSHRRADVEAPQRLQLLVVEGGERAVERAGEDEATGGRQCAGIIWVVELGRRLHLAGRHVDCRNYSPRPLAASGDAAVPERAAHPGLVDLELSAPVIADAVGKVL